jgi:urea transport system permease protein
VLIAIRDREDRVRFSGYDTAHDQGLHLHRFSDLLSSIGGAYLRPAGGLGNAKPRSASVTSVEMVIYAAVGGRLSVVGAVIGALLVGFMKSYLSESFPEIWLYFLGALFIFVVWVLPNGLAGSVSEDFQGESRNGSRHGQRVSNH